MYIERSNMFNEKNGMSEITISIISLNQCNDLKRLLPSLVAAARRAQAVILLVDNHSIDGTSEYVKHNFPEIQITYNPNKTGYGGNHNINLSKAATQYFVIMNSDMTVEPDVFVKLRDFMDKNPDVGIVSPKVLNEDGSVQFLNRKYPSILSLLLRRFAPKRLSLLFKTYLDSHEMKDTGYDTIYEVEFQSGTFMFCRADLLKLIGGFDTRYFMYFEDADLCRKVQQNNFKTVYYPMTAITHFWTRASYNSWFSMSQHIRSAVMYFNKWGYKFF
jgi:GT2 family glycosyltransferase